MSAPPHSYTLTGNLLACLLRALFHQQRPLPDAVASALPFAAANAAHAGIAAFDLPA